MDIVSEKSDKCIGICKYCATCGSFIENICTSKFDVYTIDCETHCCNWIMDVYTKCKYCNEFVKPTGPCLQTGWCKTYKQYHYPNHICIKADISIKNTYKYNVTVTIDVPANDLKSAKDRLNSIISDNAYINTKYTVNDVKVVENK